MALRRQRMLHRVGELDVARARRQPHRLQVVHARAQQPALDDVLRHPEILLPVGHQHHAAEMAAGRMAGQIDAVRIAAEARGVLVDPGDRAAHLARPSASGRRWSR